MNKLVNVAFRKLEQRADVLGDELFNKRETKLVGCRKIKFRQLGIRIVYRIIGDKTEIVQIISIGKRQEDEVYKMANKRLEQLRKNQ